MLAWSVFLALMALAAALGLDPLDTNAAVGPQGIVTTISGEETNGRFEPRVQAEGGGGVAPGRRPA
jgi:hypothetical protein